MHMDTKLKVQVILASVRQGRFGDKPANWIVEQAKEAGFETELVDLKDWELPFYNEKGSPNALKGVFENQKGMEWNKLLSGADAYIVVTPEYNHGYPASLKNNFDWTYPANSVAQKPVAFVSYGTVGGTRAVQQLRQVAIEMQMVNIRNGVHLTKHWELQDEADNLKPEAAEALAPAAKALLEQLAWYSKALKVARDSK
jgi:NAD(P)H-dependent FMN reductase